MTLPPPLVVFTDLDGTLLDHATYDWRDAGPALAALKARGIPVILASSKTAAEIVPLQQEIGLQGLPAIVENGAGTVSGSVDGRADNTAYRQIRAALAALPDGLGQHFTGFGDMDSAQIAALTGLSPQAADRARQRCFSEPGQWHGSAADRQRFLDLLQAQGITARRGGRFLTLSFGQTKADRMKEIAAAFGTPPSVALGDAPNDVEMLETADTGVIVANPASPPLPRLDGETGGRILRTRAPGPSGWNTAVLAIIERMENKASTDPNG